MTLALQVLAIVVPLLLAQAGFWWSLRVMLESVSVDLRGYKQATRRELDDLRGRLERLEDRPSVH